MTVTIYSNYRWLWIPTAGLAIVIWLDDYAGWRILLFGLLFAWLIGRLWVRGLADGLRLQRELRFGWAQVGDQLEQRFTLINRAPVPALWVELVDESNLPDYNQRLVTGVEAGGSSSWRTQDRCTQRGVFRLGPLRLRSGDPLGLFTVEISDPATLQLVVTPPVVPLPQIMVAGGGRAGDGRRQPNSLEQTVTPEYVREYQPGDRPKAIHWPTSARRDGLYVRTFDSTPSGDWWIVIDANRDVQAGAGYRSTLEHAVILAASLAERGMHLRRSVGLVAMGAALTWLPPQRSADRQAAILSELARLEAGETALATLLQRLENRIGGPSSLILITPDAGGVWLPKVLPLMGRGSVVTALLLDPARFEAATASEAAPILAGEDRPVLAEGSVPALALELRRLGIASEIITPELLDRPEARPGREGQWEWRITPGGRAVAVHAPRQTAWRPLHPRGGE